MNNDELLEHFLEQAEEAAATSTDSVEEERPKRQINVDVVGLILGIATKLLQESPDEKLHEVLYQVAKSILRQPGYRQENIDITPVLHLYYLEAYATYRLHIEEVDMGQEALLIEASIALFDIYTHNRNEKARRRLLIHGVEKLQEVTLDKLSYQTDIPMKVAMGFMHNLTLLSSTLGDYINSSTMRARNGKYVEWLKDLFQRVMTADDLSFLTKNPQILLVVKQLINNDKKIALY